MENYRENIINYLKAKHGKVEDNWMELIDILCNEVNLYHQAQEQIKANGIVIVNQRGIIANPAVRIGENAVVQIHKPSV